MIFFCFIKNLHCISEFWQLYFARVSRRFAINLVLEYCIFRSFPPVIQLLISSRLSVEQLHYVRMYTHVCITPTNHSNQTTNYTIQNDGTIYDILECLVNDIMYMYSRYLCILFS